MKQIAYLSLGTNIEPRKKHLIKALELLEQSNVISIIKKSSIYETAPVGYTNQADFLNMVIELRTNLSSIQLLEYCQKVEQELGRKREIRFGPRTIDLDILLYNQEVMTEERLTIPHPRMHERAFVLIPLCEIAPNISLPDNESIQDFIHQLSKEELSGVRKWEHH